MLILGCHYTYVIQCGIHVYVYSCASAVQCMHTLVIVHTYIYTWYVRTCMHGTRTRVQSTIRRMKIYTFAWKIEKMYYVYVYGSRSRAHRVFGAKKSRLTCSAISFRTSFYLAFLGHI